MFVCVYSRLGYGLGLGGVMHTPGDSFQGDPSLSILEENLATESGKNIAICDKVNGKRKTTSVCELTRMTLCWQ
jgi:hypothetical protein